MSKFTWEELKNDGDEDFSKIANNATVAKEQKNGEMLIDFNKANVRKGISQKKEVQKKKSSKKIAIKAKVLAIALALTLVGGVALAEAYEHDLGNIKTYCEYSTSQSDMANWMKNYDTTQEGHQLRLFVDENDNGQINYQTENYTGLYNYINHFDDYYKEKTGKDYYESMLKQVQDATKMGIDPNTISIYSQEKLEEIVSSNVKGGK